ncbi:hypothetical protein [Gordonia polyisoprenivorans]|uniref:hypothetical protein n=1 Tax=Gordonia polyisoprenivorans TaxID=84595 RepID=UPI001AD66A46|nr:hypothetical protein [Gordonia polyisoprenivorans]QTI67275.1 hypothetical protein J6U32_16805 [Gordonia polyisoprenivorans]
MVVGAGLLLSAGGAVAVAPAASALTVSPVPGGGAVELTSGEARVVHDAHIGGVVDAALPQFGRSQYGRTVGQAIEYRSGIAAQNNQSLYISYRTLPGGNSTIYTGTR